MQHSYYGKRISDFLKQSDNEILGVLTKAHHFSLDESQRDAWRHQIKFLKSNLEGMSDGFIHFEFMIPRMGKRADCVIVCGEAIFVIEFKVGAKSFDRSARDQVHDYALDLKNFHYGSHGAFIIPIVIATEAVNSHEQEVKYAKDRVATPINVSSGQLRLVIEWVVEESSITELDHDVWLNSGYKPTPTIIEAATALYAEHKVSDISCFDAGAKNLESTNTYISSVIEEAKLNNRKAICFITGVPGAGKTLAGLNIATQRARMLDEHAVFLSGNGPLVLVLSEALARDQSNREGTKKVDAKRKVKAFIQNIHHFRDENLKTTEPPIERVVIFDEAQRAWTKEQASKFMQQKRGIPSFDVSEPDFLISVMDRHEDWSVIVCLIGGGQEINTGEAGLGEWLRALKAKYLDWDIHASSLLIKSDYTIDSDARALLEDAHIKKSQDLHLAVSMRSFRAEKLNGFVSALLAGSIADAREIYWSLSDRYPIRITRDLNTAKEWLRKTARATERYGLVASSGGVRLRPEGINVKVSLDAENWFLNDSADVRSSYYLEEAATEFDIQGLELDWVCLAWDADLRWLNGAWETYSFRGNKWQSIQSASRKNYLINAYRVLLTRARQGLVIFVPIGDDRDVTRPAAYYDGIYDALLSCGLKSLDS